MWDQGHLSPKALIPATGRGKETCKSRPTVTFMPALQARGRGRNALTKRYALHISEATAFAFKAEILLSGQCQQLELGPR